MQQRDDDVYASAALRGLLDEQKQALMPELQRCAGAHALLLGAYRNDVPPALPMMGCWTTLRISGERYAGDLHAAADEPLPFVDEAFELVLLRHALEVAPLPAALLAEAVRVLAPGGVLTVTGMHPLSSWAPWFYWRTRGSARALQMPLRLQHDLRHAGLQVEHAQRVGRAWPAQLPQGGRTRASSTFGGGYVLVARKRRHLVSPLRVRQVPVRMPASGQLSPGTRRSSACNQQWKVE